MGRWRRGTASDWFARSLLQGDPDAKAFDEAGAPFGGQAVSSDLEGRLSLAAREPLEGDSFV